MNSSSTVQQSPKSKMLLPSAVLESVKALPHTPPYKIHRYFARRPWNVFEKIIETYTSLGDVILDPFMGGGVTIYEGLKLKRRVIGFDLNPLSHFIVTSMVQTNLQAEDLEKYFLEINRFLEEKTLEVNLIDEGQILWNELTYVVECNHCKKETALSNDLKIGNGKYRCQNPECPSSSIANCAIKPKDCRRIRSIYLHSVIKESQGGVKIVAITEDRQKIIADRSKALAKSLNVEAELNVKTLIPKNWDRQKEDLLENKGFIHFEDFFTPINLVINLGLRKKIKEMDMPEAYRSFFRLVFSSSLRDTNVMAFTNDGWQGGKPTTWSRHAYWIPSQFCEVSVIEAFKRAFQRSLSSLKFSQSSGLNADVSSKWSADSKKNAFIINGNLAESEIPDNSVDAIITDPPYGSNVQYLELSHFWFPWNQDLYEIKLPNFSQEAISNRKKNFDGAKSMIEYEENLYKVFKKGYQVLKAGGVLTLTFNNKDMGAWLALLISIFRSGYTLSAKEIYFQDGVDNYKQTAHTRTDGSPYGDFIYVFRKPKDDFLIKQVVELQEFFSRMDAIFLKNDNNLTPDSGRYEQKRDRFINAIDVIHAFAVYPLTRVDKEELFKHFNKNYLDSFYV